jgi:hypothetical protein
MTPSELEAVITAAHASQERVSVETRCGCIITGRVASIGTRKHSHVPVWFGDATYRSPVPFRHPISNEWVRDMDDVKEAKFCRPLEFGDVSSSCDIVGAKACSVEED